MTARRWLWPFAHGFTGQHHEHDTLQQTDEDPPPTPIELYDNEQTPGDPS